MITPINNRLFLGSALDAAALHRNNPEGITAIVNFSLEADRTIEGIRCLHHPMHQGYIPASALDVALASLAEQLGCGKVLVHCWMGISRSAIVVALYLSIERQISLDAALAELRTLRLQVRPCPLALESARTYLRWRRLRGIN